MTPEEARRRLLQYAHWYVNHKERIFYEMARPFPLGAHLPQYNDCSATFTNIYYLAGLHDPNGFNFSGFGNTASLAMNGQAITKDLRVGDAVIYYNGHGFSPWDSEHVAILVNSDQYNPLTMSHGWSEEPSFVHVMDDARPHRFFRYGVNSRF